MQGVGLNTWDVSSVVSFNRLFHNCENAFNENLSTWDTSSGQDFYRIFRDTFGFNQDFSNFDFRNAKDIREFMFGKSSANYNYQYYDNLLFKLESHPTLGGLDFGKLTNVTTDMGTIQFSAKGIEAIDSLIAKGLVITDGGWNGVVDAGDAFISTYNVVGGEVLTIASDTHRVTDWGDGNLSEGNSHTYEESGIYTVSIYGIVDDYFSKRDSEPQSLHQWIVGVH